MGADINEFMLASRLQGIRANPDKVKTLLPFDFYNLLRCEDTKSVSVEDILGDDPLNLLSMDDTDGDIFSLKHVKKSDRIRPDFVSRRNKCKNITEYEAMFESVHSDLKAGRRKLVEFKEKDLIEGRFFVLRGILVFLEKSDDMQQEFNYDSGSRTRSDGRTRCIFDNGTESDMLFRSLYKALLKDGFGVSDREEPQKTKTEISEEDVQNGYIYVLGSLSTDPQIVGMKDLYKIGCCSGDVTERIKNAANEPTYLMREVKVLLTVRCFNINVFNFERTIHDFFGKSNVVFEVFDKNGNKHYPREWYIVPLNVIEETINLIVDGEIQNYEYNTELQLIIKKNTEHAITYDYQSEILKVAEESNPANK